MYGKNPIRKQDLAKDRLEVHSIFSTIQGEGPSAGQPAMFIRLGGCNLQCAFCDTDFETDVKDWSVKDIVERVEALHRFAYMRSPLVVITGGEPLRQNIIPLIKSLIGHGYQVDVETSGSLYIPGLLQFWYENTPFRGVICSPKTGKLQEELGPMIIAYKYIIEYGKVGEDGLPDFIPSTGNPKPVARPFTSAPVYVQACDESDAGRARRNMEETIRSATQHGYILSFQIHKAIGLE